MPERGRIGIFNRSYYEEVLIVRVRPDILQAQRLPDFRRADQAFWDARFRSIVESELHLHRNGTRIVKFFLHISKAEQRERLIARIDDPEKNWKFSEDDLTQRRHWEDYMHAYEDCLAKTSTAEAPWHVVPADDKKNARLIISQIVVDTLSALELTYPQPSASRRCRLSGACSKTMADAWPDVRRSGGEQAHQQHNQHEPQHTSKGPGAQARFQARWPTGATRWQPGQ